MRKTTVLLTLIFFSGVACATQTLPSSLKALPPPVTDLLAIQFDFFSSNTPIDAKYKSKNDVQISGDTQFTPSNGDSVVIKTHFVKSLYYFPVMSLTFNRGYGKCVLSFDVWPTGQLEYASGGKPPLCKGIAIGYPLYTGPGPTPTGQDYQLTIQKVS